MKRLRHKNIKNWRTNEWRNGATRKKNGNKKIQNSWLGLLLKKFQEYEVQKLWFMSWNYHAIHGFWKQIKNIQSDIISITSVHESNVTNTAGYCSWHSNLYSFLYYVANASALTDGVKENIEYRILQSKIYNLYLLRQWKIRISAPK